MTRARDNRRRKAKATKRLARWRGERAVWLCDWNALRKDYDRAVAHVREALDRENPWSYKILDSRTPTDEERAARVIPTVYFEVEGLPVL